MKRASILMLAAGLLATPLWAGTETTTIETPATVAPGRPIARIETETPATPPKVPSPAATSEAPEEPRCEDQSNWDERGWAFLGRPRDSR